MDCQERVQLDTGNHQFLITLTQREVTLLEALIKKVPEYAALQHSPKLSDKLMILVLYASAVEQKLAEQRAQQEWPGVDGTGGD